MDIRDTVSRVLLGIAFGFVMGIVMYQAAGIDADVINKGTVHAELEVCDPGLVSCGFGGLCCADAGDCNIYTLACDTFTDPPPPSTDPCAEDEQYCVNNVDGSYSCCTASQHCGIDGQCTTLPSSSSDSSTTSEASSSSSGGCCNMTTNSCE